MLSNLSDLLNQRVDPKATQQAPPQRATAADSSFLLQQVQQRAPQMQQFYNNPNNTAYSYPTTFKNQPGMNRSMNEQQKAKYFPPVQQVAEVTKKRVATEKGRIAAGQAPKTKKGQDITNEQEIQNIQNDESGFISPNVYQGRNFNPGAGGQNIDFNAPYAVYDPRIEPQQIRVSDSPAGVNTSTVPMYDPLAITPWAQLNKEDQKLRLEKYGTTSTPYENAPPKLLPYDGSNDNRMSVEVQGSPTGTIAVQGSGGSGNFKGGNKTKAKAKVAIIPARDGAPAEAVYLNATNKAGNQKISGKSNAQKQVSGEEFDRVMQGLGEEPANANAPRESSSSMVAMAPGSYIQNAAPNARQNVAVDESGYEYSQPYKVVNNPYAYGLLNQPTTLSGQNIEGSPSQFSPNAVVVDGVPQGLNPGDYENLPYGFVRKKVSTKQGGVPAGWKNETSKMSKEEASKYVEDYYKNQDNKKWWESISAKKK
jgi:hypothetical protein